jgi:hypothetical protein
MILIIEHIFYSFVRQIGICKKNVKILWILPKFHYVMQHLNFIFVSWSILRIIIEF